MLNPMESGTSLCKEMEQGPGPSSQSLVAVLRCDLCFTTGPMIMPKSLSRGSKRFRQSDSPWKKQQTYGFRVFGKKVTLQGCLEKSVLLGMGSNPKAQMDRVTILLGGTRRFYLRAQTCRSFPRYCIRHKLKKLIGHNKTTYPQGVSPRTSKRTARKQPRHRHVLGIFSSHTVLGEFSSTTISRVSK